jgi:assimilatory nitrate reductase catalytic subunit
LPAGAGGDDDPAGHGVCAHHWAGAKSINRLTIAAQDPISKIPEYKVCAVKVRKADGPPAYAGALEAQQ